MSDEPTAGRQYRFGRCVVDADRFELRRDGERVEMQPKVLSLLVYLLSQRHRVVAKDELLDAVWGDVAVTEASLSRAVSLARDALAETSPAASLIRTVRGRGYGISPDVEVEEAREAPSTADWHASARSAVRRLSSLEGRPVIAVLPFENRSGEPDQDPFVLGISEDLIGRLSTWRSFPVISGSRSFAAPAPGARYLVLGSVRRSDERVRVAAELIDAESGRQIWSERFDRELREVFALQDEIATAIVESMRPQLWEFDRERAAVGDPASFEAWDWAQRGWWHLYRFQRDDVAAARGLFERALAIDADFVSALYGLAMGEYFDVMNGWSASPDEAVGRLHRHAERAIAADERNALGHLALGCAFSLSGPNARAVAAFAMAVELNPSSTWGAIQLGTFLALGGRPDEGIRALETAARLDARHPLHWSYLFGMSLAHFAAGRWERCAGYAERCLGRRPHWAALPLGLRAACHVFLERPDEARADLAELGDVAELSEFQSAIDGFVRGWSAEIAARLRQGLRAAGR